jgi:3'(2'), 5'-bisphosphate nucleotidase
MTSININIMAEIAIKASHAILACEMRLQATKSDLSPLTEADMAAHHALVDGLQAAYPHIPIISEEGNVGEENATYFLIDPLDGTKEYIKGSDEFTINLALIDNGYPIKSVMVVPKKNEVYCADGFASLSKINTFKSHESAKKIKMRTAPAAPIALLSQSHPEGELEYFYEKNNYLTKKCGSAYKFCVMAKGEADVYARFKHLSSWDIAAGQALIEAAGGVMTTHEGKRLSYAFETVKADKFIAKHPLTTAYIPKARNKPPVTD